MLMDILRIYVSFIKCVFISILAEVASKTEIKTALVSAASLVKSSWT